VLVLLAANTDPFVVQLTRFVEVMIVKYAPGSATKVRRNSFAFGDGSFPPYDQQPDSRDSEQSPNRRFGHQTGDNRGVGA